MTASRIAVGRCRTHIPDNTGNGAPDMEKASGNDSNRRYVWRSRTQYRLILRPIHFPDQQFAIVHTNDEITVLRSNRTVYDQQIAIGNAVTQHGVALHPSIERTLGMFRQIVIQVK